MVFSAGDDVDGNSASVVLSVEFSPEVRLLGDGEGMTVVFAPAGLEVELPEFGLGELVV